ncbi:hypothetical protein [Sporomusa acidovorans]|uniref:Spo0E like sporulation regulatory protein n=1 Tax=Sporomusa acidovorans (strain ATCC 49682 / DSM 3132 / Mol) TaxID=1123286 RepID=A0ABZ3JAD1_SPOA4|nr:hypothetical protein [Sporomusa acidovorans]OZC13276.1 hypothetical protein SPACI_57710 [Sporomusa acidovorans DSM 3132]SDD98467.1 hypothetical protein SAMN04488499_100679 [Sporomusa acidovorans]
MCGMNWYREAMERADDNIDRLNELLTMMEQRYKLSPNADPSILAGLHADIVEIYRELMWRKNALQTQNPGK